MAKKPPAYATDYNLNRFKQRRQFLRMMNDWKPENFDMGMVDDEN